MSGRRSGKLTKGQVGKTAKDPNLSFDCQHSVDGLNEFSKVLQEKTFKTSKVNFLRFVYMSDKNCMIAHSIAISIITFKSKNSCH